MNKKIFLTILGLATAGVVTVGATQASAHFWGDDDFSSKLATKLGVSEDKVKSALDSLRAEKRTDMQATLDKRLTQGVVDKKITEAQKQLILNKYKEMRQNRESWENLTPEERKDKVSAARDQLKAWAESNNINLGEWFGMGMRHHGRGMW
jgi:hypothetical protein